jgi:hypothetical protein
MMGGASVDTCTFGVCNDPQQPAAAVVTSDKDLPSSLGQPGVACGEQRVVLVESVAGMVRES